MRDGRLILSPLVSEGGLCDYKVHVFNGKAKFVLVCSQRFSADGVREDFFDLDWNHLQVKRPNIKESDIELKKPVNFEKMIAFAEKLGAGIPFVRIDFYEVDSCLKFGEITFYPATGMEKFDPEDYDLRFGELLVLSCEMKKSF